MTVATVNNLGTEPRIGVYVCHCGLNIAGVLPSAALAAQSRELPGVVVSRHQLYSCSEAGQQEILQDIATYQLNRLVIAACSPKLHEPTFRRLLAAAGLNPYLVEMVNLREQCSWVHFLEPEAAAAKAWDLIRMGVAKVRLAQPLYDRQVPVVRRALVIGGGAAGLRAALDIAAAGHEVVLVEKKPYLGGWTNYLHRIFPTGQRALTIINPLMAAVSCHPRITVLTSSQVVGWQGYLGNYQVQIRREPQYISSACDGCGACLAVCPPLPEGHRALSRPLPQAFPAAVQLAPDLCTRCGACLEVCPRDAIRLDAAPELLTLTVGVAVVATGFSPFEPTGSRYEAWTRLPGVYTTLDLEKLLAQGQQALPPVQDIAFILCVGSREETGNRHCSRICCATAIKQALTLKELLPQARIRVYYRDIRTVRREWEAMYTQARERGILFLRGLVQEVSQEAGRLRITASNDLLDAITTDTVDLVILAIGLTPGEGRALQEVMKLPVGEDGFFLEAHPKLRPLETVLDGVFLAGTCQGPKDLSATLAQASGAAAKVIGLFAHDYLTLDGIVSTIDPERCTGCQRCWRECPFQAIELYELAGQTKARIITSACKGCGVCAGACPSGAVTAHGFTDDMILAQIDAALAEAPESKILAFACNWCSYAGADFAGVSRLPYPPNVRLIRTMCAGRVHPKFIRHALAKGAGMVLVTGCHPPGDCHYLSGNLRAQARVVQLQKKLAAAGLDPDRVQLAWISATEGRAFQELMQRLAQKLAAGTAPAPNPEFLADEAE